MLGPYIKSRGTRGTKMSVNADLIAVETYVQQVVYGPDRPPVHPPPPGTYETYFILFLGLV